MISVASRLRGGGRPERGALLALAVLIASVAPLRAQTLDDRVYAVARQLMCPVCAGQTVAESDSSLAGEMRAVIRQKLVEGATGDEILRYFVSQFGEGVLAEPPRRGMGILLYVGPFLALALGLVIAAVYIRRWTGRGAASDSSHFARRAHDPHAPS